MRLAESLVMGRARSAEQTICGGGDRRDDVTEAQVDVSLLAVVRDSCPST